MSDIGQKRRVWRVADLKLEPFNRYGDDVAKLHWSPVTFDRETGKGAFIIRFDPGGESVPHEHLGYEEFYVIEGTVVDHDGVTYEAGDFVSLGPGTKHYSRSPDSALIVAFLTDNNRVLEADEQLSWGQEEKARKAG